MFEKDEVKKLKYNLKLVSDLTDLKDTYNHLDHYQTGYGTMYKIKVVHDDLSILPQEVQKDKYKGRILYKALKKSLKKHS